MSIFGKLDAANVSANANFIEAGDYLAEITDAEYRTSNSGDRQIVIEYTVTNEDSAFKGSKAREYLKLPPADFTAEQFELMPPDEKKKLRESMAKVKARLCGYSDKNVGLGIKENDLNDPEWTPAVLKGTAVRLGINNGASGQYINIKYVALQDS
jgi:hypothetical protein